MKNSMLNLKKVVITMLCVVMVSTVVVSAIQPALAGAPNISGSISAPSVVNTGSSFKVSVSISNYGNSPAYYVKVRLNVPSGFSGRNLEVYAGDLSPGRSKTLSFQVTAPSYTTSGSFSAHAFYSDNAAGKGTMWVAYILGPTTWVYAPTKYKVTFIVQASMPMKYAWVIVYDTSTGQQVAAGAGRATTSTQSSISMTLDLPMGNYKASAGAVISTPKGPANAIGWRYFSVRGAASVLIVVQWI